MKDRDPIWRRYRELIRRRPADDVDAEVRLHLEMRREEALRAGLNPEHADAVARERFGDVDGVVAELNAIDGSRERRRARGDWFGDLRQDVRFALRSLRRSPSFAITAVATLAIAIGANTTIFSFVHSLLIAPLPYRDPDTLVGVQANIIGSMGEMLAIRERTRAFSELGIYRSRAITLNDDRDAARIAGTSLTANVIRMLGVKPLLGAGFPDDAGRPGSARVILLSHALWMERYAGDTTVVGRRVSVEGAPSTIVGVMPRDFHFPDVSSRFWTPLTIDPTNITSTWTIGGNGFIARLAPGVSAEQATAQLTAILPGMRRLNPVWDPGDQYGTSAAAQRLQDDLVATERPALLLLMSCVVVVLLVACVNIANLMLARVTAREREFAVRAALGGGRWRMIRQLLTESLVLASVGAMLGVALAYAGVRWGAAALPSSVARPADVHVDAAVLLFTTALTIVTGIAFGLLPAIRAASGTRLAGATHAGRGAVGARSHRLPGALVVAEIALAVVLAIVGGLFARSFERQRSLSPGFETANVVSARISPPFGSYGGNNAARASVFYETLLERLAAAPGISRAGIVDRLPIAAPVFGMGVRIEGQFEDGSRLLPMANHLQVITPGYLDALGLSVLQGRTFDKTDRGDAPPVALVSQSFVRRFWPNQNPIGKRLGYPYQSPWITVVGVVPDIKLDSLRDTSDVAVLIPFGQRVPFAAPEMFAVVRSNGDVAAIAGQIRDIVSSIDATVPVTLVQSMDDVVARSVAKPRFTTNLVLGFALVALLLGATGIYGVMSYVVSQREREMGVRVALGATTTDIVALVLRRGAVLAVLGTVSGCVLAAISTRVVASMLFGVSPTDPLTFGGAAVVFVVVAVLASTGPARRATRADPIETLRGS